MAALTGYKRHKKIEITPYHIWSYLLLSIAGIGFIHATASFHTRTKKAHNEVVHKEKYTFNKKQIRKLLSTADVKMKAMIWLSLNCGFGCTDCSRLKWEDLDFKNSRVELPRNKTKINRNLPLWPETIQALKEIPRSGALVFTTSKDHPWIRTTATTNDNGESKYIIDNRISTKFSRLMKKVRIQAPKGTGFYTLRRTSTTMAARSGDPFAVQRLLGHADLTMATRYVQDVSEQTDRVIENSRKHFIGKEDVA
jgi:integrase